MKRKRIGVFGCSLNPPGSNHAEINDGLLKICDEVYIRPCGSDRPDKPSVGDIAPIYRAAMADIGFYNAHAQSLRRPFVDLYDLEYGVFTRTHDLDREMKERNPGAEIWHFVGGDWVVGGANGASRLQNEWVHGRELWESLNFIVGTRAGVPFDKADLPPHAEVMVLNHPGSSSEIRDLVFHGKPYGDKVKPDVAEFIGRYNIYRGGLPNHSAIFQKKDPTIAPYIDLYRKDELNEFLKRKFSTEECNLDHPDIIPVIGGDGTMHKAVNELWRERRPFLGINKGGVGYLMNDVRRDFNGKKLLNREMEVHHCPMLHVEIETRDGQKFTEFVFNDAWVEKTEGKPVWVRISINDKVWIEKLVGIGALVSTPQGSTAFAMSTGAPTLPFSTDAWLLAGIDAHDIYKAKGIKSATLPKILESNCTVTLENADDSSRRPLRAFVNEKKYTDVVKMKAWVSKIASAELLFLPGQHLEEKRFGMRRIR